MECRHGNFWIGLGLGSILGAIAYRLSRTAKAKQLENEIYDAIHRIGRDAEAAAACAEKKAMNLGLKAVETGAEIADKVAAGEDIKAQEIREMVDAKKGEEKEKRSIAEQKADQMSDTDTNEEEKENARRLHALKMLEKYYIYMSDEEVGILERMLEDCKRRKREYGLDDVGSTV